MGPVEILKSFLVLIDTYINLVNSKLEIITLDLSKARSKTPSCCGVSSIRENTGRCSICVCRHTVIPSLAHWIGKIMPDFILIHLVDVPVECLVVEAGEHYLFPSHIYSFIFGKAFSVSVSKQLTDSEHLCHVVPVSFGFSESFDVFKLLYFDVVACDRNVCD